MSTALHDFPSAVVAGAGLYPAEWTESVTGPAVDLGAGDGPAFAVQVVGAVAAGTTLAGHLEQSATGTSGWAAIPGATFTAVTAGARIEAIRFTPTARYVRWVGAVTGDDASVLVAVVVGRQRKTF